MISLKKIKRYPRVMSLNSPRPRVKNVRALSPLPIRSFDLVNTNGVQALNVSDVTPSLVGWKAFGLSTIPKIWAPPFFVVSADVFSPDNDPEIIKNSIRNACENIKITEQSKVLVRSSGIEETIESRGKFESRTCVAKDILSCAQMLIQRLDGGGSNVHLVVQQAVTTLEKGHLSNERRLCREPRDWVAEFEPTNGELGRLESVAVRIWRSGKLTDTISELLCHGGTAIGIVLRVVGTWAMQFACRMHFEWVWDGTAVWLVQADKAPDGRGVDPRLVVPKRITPIKTDQLLAFRPVDKQDFCVYKKLRNARIYSELGYEMPPFYVLDKQEVILGIINGAISDALASDLRLLTQRPFIIRTDGLRIPTDRREMLPRSDELRSLDDAELWLTTTFASALKDLADTELCLIAHHFIPSVASAWARAEPGNPIVRIESLWGLPEGLYWHSHDTFEVDTRTKDIESAIIRGGLEYGFRERLRHKGTFIAADDQGRWIPQITDSTHDWARSIKLKKWIFEIAQTTRRITERSSRATSVMWFVENLSAATRHKVLPWFHSDSPLTGELKAAPRRKRLSSQDVVIRHVSDWEHLKKSAEAGQAIERVIVSPIDAELIRNAEFASELAKLAKRIDFVIELSGGILSHAYYMLSREGCHVECVDLFGAGEEVIEFHKLVRDGIPDMIRDRGEKVESIALKGDALIAALRQKLVEESFETLDASSGNDLLGEIADVHEVVLALLAALNIDYLTLEAECLKKRKKRGGFGKGFMLLKTSAPQSISKGQSSEIGLGGHLSLEELPEQPLPSISEPLALPLKTQYRRPDMRSVDGALEKLFTFKVDVSALSELQQKLAFNMPISQGEETPFFLTVELDRTKATMRGKISLQIGQSQLNFPFS